MQPSPVCTAGGPVAAIAATWRYRDSSSAARRSASASSAELPAPIRSSARGPYAGSATDCVATAPMPGRAQDTIDPTENQCDWTATPSSPVAGSRATIEYVPSRMEGSLDQIYGPTGTFERSESSFQ